MCDVVFKAVNLLLFFFVFCFLLLAAFYVCRESSCSTPTFVMRFVLPFAFSSLAILSQMEYERASGSANSVVDIVQESLFYTDPK